jgi:hypothetical protein
VTGLLTQTAFRQFGIFVDPFGTDFANNDKIILLFSFNLLMQIRVALSGEPKNK